MPALLAVLCLAPFQDADPARIEALIRRLGAEDFAAREEAGGELRRIGEPAREALRKAAEESADPEVRERARALLAPEPAPDAPERPGKLRILGGGSVSVVNVNGDATYTIRPNDGSPQIVFRRGADGAASLEYTDGEGAKRKAASASLEAFLKEHAALAKTYGIDAEGISYAGQKVGFKGAGLNFDLGKAFGRPFPSPPFRRPGRGAGADFGPVDATLRAQLDLPEQVGAVILRVPEGSDAERAGLRRHDVLLEIDGRPATSPEDAAERLKADSRGQLLRKGRRERFGEPRRDF
jgi:hypothetical protein